MLLEVGKAYGWKLFEYDIELLLAPGMNIHRHPLGARNFEYYVEDPVLPGMSAATMTKGIRIQGSGVTRKNIAANNQEINRMGGDAIVSERALHEIYLKGFEIAVKTANPWAMMASYVRINGVYAGESPELLKDILRDEWGFTGLVMIDWTGAGVTYSGCGRMMPSKNESSNFTSGRVTIDDLRAPAKAICGVIFKTKAFADFACIDYVYGYEAGENWIGVQKSAIVSGPASAHVNELFTITATVDRKYTGVKLVNETGRAVSIANLNVARDSESVTWNVTTQVGTAGVGRTFTLLFRTVNSNYQDVGVSFTLDIQKNTTTGAKEEIISAAFDKASVKVNATVGVTVISNSATTQVNILNENGGKMGKTLVSKSQEGSKIIWKYEMAIGSKGNARTFAFAGAKADGVFSDPVAVAVIKVVA